MDKADEEIKRYERAYGSGAMELDHYNDLVCDVRKRKSGYQKQMDELNNKIAQEGLDLSQLDLICEEAKKIISSLDLANKKEVVRDIITKVIVKGDRKVEVRGRLPLFALNMGYVVTSRDSGAS